MIGRRSGHEIQYITLPALLFRVKKQKSLTRENGEEALGEGGGRTCQKCVVARNFMVKVNAGLVNVMISLHIHNSQFNRSNI